MKYTTTPAIAPSKINSIGRFLKKYPQTAKKQSMHTAFKDTKSLTLCVDANLSIVRIDDLKICSAATVIRATAAGLRPYITYSVKQLFLYFFSIFDSIGTIMIDGKTTATVARTAPKNPPA